jgi:hypothetical protein
MPLFVRVECPRSCLRVGLGYAGERVVRKQVVYRLQQRGTTRRLIQPLPALLSGVGWLRFSLILVYRFKASIRGGWTQRYPKGI